MYLKAQEEITLLREKRTAGNKRLDEISHTLDELINTLNVSEALLRLKELTGVLVRIEIQKASMGRVCGKNMSNVGRGMRIEV